MMLYVVCTIVSNVIEKADILTQAQVAELQVMTEHQLVETKHPDVGMLMAEATTPKNVVSAIWKAMWFDYSFFYKIDLNITTESACEAAGGKWHSDICQIPSEWMAVRYVLFYPITIGMLLYMALYLRRMTLGGGG